MEHQIQIKETWTDTPSAQVKGDFIQLANTVFGTFVTESYFKSKFEDNIYGPSLLTVVYVDGQPAGADVMWRNDLWGERAYQTVDTCVLERFRGMGLFKSMTRWELERFGKDTLVYGFPNVNSFPGYVKMGWHVEYLHKTLCLPVKHDEIDHEYAVWWLKAQAGISVVQRKGKFYLIRKKKRNPVATLIGQIDETAASLFPESKGTCLYNCFKKKSSIYNMTKSIPLVCNQTGVGIPYWKIDAI